MLSRQPAAGLSLNLPFHGHANRQKTVAGRRPDTPTRGGAGPRRAALRALTAADLALEKLRTAPAGSLTSLDQAIGRTPWRALSAGTWLNEESFEAGGPLARMIRPDERALAVAVDEVIGAAGQLSPAIMSMCCCTCARTEQPEQSAQIVMPAMRLLGVGDQLGLTNDGKPATPALQHRRKTQADNSGRRRTVVLAVPEQLLSRLMLATQAGTLRLAVRSAEEQRLAKYWAGETDSAANLEKRQPRPLPIQPTGPDSAAQTTRHGGTTAPPRRASR